MPCSGNYSKTPGFFFSYIRLFPLSVCFLTLFLTITPIHFATVLAQEGKQPSKDEPEAGEAMDFGEPVDDRFFPKSDIKVIRDLDNTYKKYLRDHEKDFERSMGEIHEKKRTAERTGGYLDLKELHNKVVKWRKTYEEAEADARKSLSGGSSAIKTAFEKQKEATDTDKEPQSDEDIVNQALGGQLGPLDARTQKLLRRYRSIIKWLSVLRPAEKKLSELLQILEDNGEPYDTKKKVSDNSRWQIQSELAQNGTIVDCTIADDRISCVVEEPSASAVQELGLKAGDPSLQVELKDADLSGSQFSAVPLEAQGSCPEFSGVQPYEIRNATISSDRRTISGEAKFPVFFLMTCRILPDVDAWAPFTYVRIE